MKLNNIMGCTHSTTTHRNTAASAVTTASSSSNNNKNKLADGGGSTGNNNGNNNVGGLVLEEYELKKHRPECSGMFWRSDPIGETVLQSNNNWPRDGAKLRGTSVTVDGER